MTVTYILIIGFSAFFFACVGTMGVRMALEHFSVMDHPEERSNHKVAVPRGGGIAVVFSMLCFLMAVRAPEFLVIAILLAAGVSWWDDLKKLSVKQRLPVHALAAICAVAALHDPVFQGLLPPWLDNAVAVLLVIWFMNLFNFMDGIDEISVMQAVSLCLGAMLLEGSVPGLPRSLMFDGAAVIGAMFGFWLFNRHPARIFLGDVGSVPVGLTLAFFLLEIAGKGYWQAALILPAYYLTDASLTLGLRLLKGRNIAQSHSDHAYQQAVRRGWRHTSVVEYIFALNIILMALAVASAAYPAYGLIAVVVAYGLSLALMFVFTATSRAAPLSHEAA